MPANQYGVVPGLPQGNSSVPGAVPSQNWQNPNPLPSGTQVPMNYSYGPGGTAFEQPLVPGLTENWSQYLGSQVGQGVTPFNLATPLSTGGETMPGQVNAPLNPILQQLQQYFQTGKSSNAGINALNEQAQGMSAVPEWQSAIAAQQQNIQQNQANLKEQFAGMGGLAGSEYGQAMQNYMQGTTANQNALLAQMQQQNEQIQQGAATTLTGLQQQVGTLFQGLNQQDIQNLMSEFIRTQPQYSPMLNYIYGQSNAYSPIFNTKTGAGIASSLIPMGAGAVAGGAGAAASGGGIMKIILGALAKL